MVPVAVAFRFRPMVTAVATVVGNLLADIGYAVLDPRVRFN